MATVREAIKARLSRLKDDVLNSTFVKGNVPSKQQQLQRVTPQFQRSVQPIARQAQIYKNVLGGMGRDIGSGINNLPQTFSMLRNNPQQFSKGVDLAIDNSQSGAKAGRYAVKGAEGFTEGMTLGTYDLPISASRNNYERGAYVAGNALGLMNPFNPVNKLAPVFKPSSRVLQQPLGHLAGRMIAQGGGKKLLGQGVANLAQGIPYTTAYAVAKTGLGGKYSGGDLATDTGTDLALGSVPLVGGLLIGAKGALKGSGKQIGTQAGDFASTVDKQLRRKISDAFSKVNMDEWTNIRNNLIKNKTGASFLKDLFKHNNLYKAYPEFRDLTVKLDPTYVADMIHGSFDPRDFSIRMNPNLSEKQIRSTMLHELQHAIGTTEQFAKGSSVDEELRKLAPVKQRLDEMVNSGKITSEEYQTGLTRLKQKAMENYRRTGGEFESRAVEGLQNMPQRELTGTDPYIGQLQKEGLTPKDLKASGGGISQSADPLIAEARRYKSAEEFVKAQTKMYQGGGTSLKIEDRVGGIYLTKSKSYADKFSNGKGVAEGYAMPKNPFDLTDQIANQPERELLIEAPQNFPREIADLKAKGYDAITYKDQVLALDPNIVKTKSQLTDIWNKANSGEMLSKVDTPKVNQANAPMMSKGVDNGVVKPQIDRTRLTGNVVRDKSGIKLQNPYTTEYLPTNSDGTITVYHSTTKEGAKKIQQSGVFGSKTEGGDIYFTTNNKGYGGIGKDKDVVLTFHVDPKTIKFDDVYRGELHLKGNNADIGGIKPVENNIKSQIDRTKLTGRQLDTPNSKLQSPDVVKAFGKQAGVKSQTKIPVKGQQGTRSRMSVGNTSRQTTRPQANASYDKTPNLSNYDQTFSKFIANREVGKTTATQTAGKYASIPRKIAKEVIDYMEGINKKASPEVQKWGKQMKAEYDRLHSVAKQSAIDAGLDVGYLENYVPHFWKESAEEVQQAFMSAKKNLPQSKERIFPTYEEGIKLGFTPKYDHPAQMMEAYVRNLEKFNASVELMKTLKANNIVVPTAVGNTKSGYIPIRAQGIGGNWYAPKEIAEQINRLFSPEPQTGIGKALGKTAKLAGAVQDLTLSGGIPGTPINAFTIAQVQKELIAGNLKSPFSAMWNSLSSKKTVKFFEDNAEQIKKMQSQNVPFTSEYAVDNMIDEKTATKIFGHGLGNTWGKLVNEPTFKRFMPMLQVNLFNQIEKQALKGGKSADEATRIASKAVKNFYGLKGTDVTAKSSQLGKDVAGTFLFAPHYRESMINMWVNTVKAMKNPLALENRTNVKFAVGAVATYFAMNALNQQYSGHPMSENPEGKKDKLLIPLSDGYTIGVPFLSSIATMPRLAYSMAEKAVKGDLTGTALEGRKALSMAIKPVIDVMANSDHFERAIVEDADLPEEKLKKQAMFLFKSYIGHPYVKELIELHTKPDKPLYQRLSNATELPLRFYETDKVEEAPFWDRYSELKDLNEQYKLIEKTNPDKALELLNENEDKINEFNLMKAYLDFQYQQIEGGEEPTGIKDYLNEQRGEKARKYEQSEDAPTTTLGKAGLYAKSGLTNPVDTFNAVRTGQPLRKMRGDATIVEREIASTDKDKNTQKDHRIPLWAGGDNSDKNTYYISTEDHKRKTQYENILRRKLESGEMKKAQVQDALKKWHVDNNIKSLMPPIKNPKIKNVKKEAENGYTYVDEKGTEKTIDLAFEPQAPMLTGNKELDKKLTAKYKGEITKKKNDILALYEQGVLTADEAEKELAKWETKSKKSGSKKAKKAPKAKVRYVTAPSFAGINPIKLSSMIQPQQQTSPRIDLNSLKLRVNKPQLRLDPRIKAGL